MRLTLPLKVAIAIATIFGLVVPTVTRAQDELKATQIVLSTSPALDALGKPLVGQYSISAVLTSTDGKNVGRRAVTFVENVEFLGLRQAKLGSDVTDRKGNALVNYQPSQSGEHTIVAMFAGDDEYAASETQFTFTPGEVVTPFPSESLPLASVGQWLSISLAIVGVAFWVVLLGVVGRAVRQIRTAGRSKVDPSAT